MTITPSPKILLIGAGKMAIEYAKVLKSLKQSFLVIGRGQGSSLSFEKATGIKPITGGLSNWLENQQPFTSNHLPAKTIVATNEEQLGPSARLLIKQGIKSLLLEKPGGLNAADLNKTRRLANQAKAKVFVAYNRRFYASTLKAKDLIKKDGGAKSFNFDFTELSHLIEKLKKPAEVKREWILMNSSHVIDLAFFLGGKPKKIKAYKTGSLAWHPSASIFSGAGVSRNGAIFSYQANWESAGRWSVEIMTPKHKIIFRPLEKLQVQKIGEMSLLEIPLQDQKDLQFKPGLYRLVKSFLTTPKYLPSISEQIENAKYYKIINNGSSQ